MEDSLKNKMKMESIGYLNDTHDEDLNKSEEGDMVLGGEKRSLFKHGKSKSKRHKKIHVKHRRKFQVFGRKSRKRGLKRKENSEQNYIYQNALHHKWSSHGKKKSRQ